MILPDALLDLWEGGDEFSVAILGLQMPKVVGALATALVILIDDALIYIVRFRVVLKQALYTIITNTDHPAWNHELDEFAGRRLLEKAVQRENNLPRLPEVLYTHAALRVCVRHGEATVQKPRVPANVGRLKEKIIPRQG